jgi:excisionase family DNA binding protein
LEKVMEEIDKDVSRPVMEELLKPSEAARMLRVSERYLQALTKGGYIPSVRLGKRAVRYTKQDIMGIITSRRTVAGVAS